jgi:hypothetical protein
MGMNRYFPRSWSRNYAAFCTAAGFHRGNVFRGLSRSLHDKRGGFPFRGLSGLFMFSVAALAIAADATTVAGTAAKAPLQVRSGAYLTSLYELNPNNNTFTADLWVWFLHARERDANPLKTLELVNARDFKASLNSTQQLGANSYHSEKIHGVFSYGWDVKDFPFDRHELKIAMEDGYLDSNELVYVPDTVNTTFDSGINIEGWRIDRVTITPGNHVYNSSFGLSEAPSTSYPSSTISIFIHRDATGLFWKLLSAVYVAFLVCIVPFFMDASKDGIFNGRIGLLVGMTFAVVISSQRVAATLGQVTSFTLADKIHLLTLIFIFCALICSLVSRHLSTVDGLDASKRFDRRMAGVFLATYTLLNFVLIAAAAS